MLKVRGLDHIVLVVADVERSLAWYRDVLGMAGERVEEWRAGTAPFPSLRVDEGTIIDLVPGQVGPGRGNVDHFCLVVEPVDWAEAAAGLDVLGGPGVRSGARGDGMSVYVKDPDGNVVELRSYGAD